MKRILIVLAIALLIFSTNSFAQDRATTLSGIDTNLPSSSKLTATQLRTALKAITNSAFDGLDVKINADYIIEKVGSTYYARPSVGLTAYSGASFSTVFSSALTALISGEIFIKSGTYTIDALISISNKNNIKITGSGKGKTVFRVNATTANGDYGIFSLSNTLTNIEISGIKFLTYINAIDASPGHLIYGNSLVKATNFSIHDCEFTAPTLNVNGVFLSCTTGDYVNNFKFYNNVCDSLGRIGVELYQDVASYANAADSSDFRNIEIYNNNFNETGMYGTWGLAISLAGNSVNIHDNLIKNNSANQAIEVGHSYSASVHDNKLYVTAASKSKYFVSGYRNYDFVLSNNTMYGVIKGSANKEAFNMTECYNTTIVGNSINAQVQRGIYINQCIKGLIQGNSLTQYGDVGIQLIAGTQNFLVEGNRVDMTNTTNCYGGINIHSNVGSTSGNVVINNYVTTAQAAKEYIQEYVTTSANVIRDHNGVYRNAVTATSDGLTTGILPQGSQAILVTSAAAGNIICLPVASTETIGTKIWGKVGGNGFELRVAASQATTVYLNGVTNNVEAAIATNVNFEAVQVDYNQWVLKAWTSLGAPVTAIVPDAN